MNQLNWPSLSTEPELAANDVHVICVGLTQEADVVTRLRGVLSPDEAERAARFHFERDRRRFTVARGVLRRVLGAYLRVAPEAVRFDYGAQGKPSLHGELLSTVALPDLTFNVSHSHELAVIAVARGRRLGVDIEHKQRAIEFEQIASRYFAEQERAELRALPQSLIAEGFFNCWTRKEAYIKAIGQGLSHPLDQFAVSLTPGRPARLLHVANDTRATERWTLHAPHVHPEYVAALMGEGRDWEYRLWQGLPSAPPSA